MKQITKTTGEFKSWEELTFIDDFLFSASMQDKKICKTLIEVLLETEITEIKYIRSQEAIESAPGRRGIRLDIRLKVDGRLINVELQNYYENDLPLRIRYYQAMVDSQQLRRGTKYFKLPEFITLFICTKDPFSSALPVYHIEHKVCEDPSIKYDDKRRIVVYNSKEWKKVKNPDLRAMLQYIDGHSPENSQKVAEFADNIKKFKDNNATAEEYMDWILMQTDYERMGEDKARAELQPIIEQKDARIAELEAQLAKYKNISQQQ